MKKLLIKKNNHKQILPQVLERCIQTVDGLEDVAINAETGEIIYTPAECIDTALLREALAKEGIETEEQPSSPK